MDLVKTTNGGQTVEPEMPKVCPIRGNCCRDLCMWWMNCANDCSIPIICSVLIDSDLCKTRFN